MTARVCVPALGHPGSPDRDLRFLLQPGTVPVPGKQQVRRVSDLLSGRKALSGIWNADRASAGGCSWRPMSAARGPQ